MKEFHTIFFLLFLTPFMLFAGIDPANPCGYIFYLEKKYRDLDSGSLVVYLERGNKRNVLCRLLKDGTERNIPLELLRPTGLTDPLDLEDINESMIFHYVSGSKGQDVFRILKKRSNSLGNSYRLNQLKKFDLELDGYNASVLKLCKELNSIGRQILAENDDERDFEPFKDKKDDIANLISKEAPPLKRISGTIDDGDFFLATAMCIKFREKYKAIRSFISICTASMGKRNEIPKDIQDGWSDIIYLLQKMSAEIEMKLVNAFNKKNEKINVRKKEYMQIFPNMRGNWSAANPVSFNELAQFFFKAHRDYQKRQDYSYLANFKEWGDCSLSMLMFAQGSEGSKTLEKNFDTGLKRMKKKAASRKKYGL